MLTRFFAVSVAIALLSVPSTPSKSPECAAQAYYGGSCTSAQTTDTTVVVTGTDTTPGQESATSGEKTTVTAGHKHKKKDTTPPKKTKGRIIVTTGSPIVNSVCTTVQLCNPAPPTAPPKPPAPPTVPVTLADIASFHPVSGAVGMEPNGWAVIGLEANPYSSAVQHVVDGQLLGRPAQVRFTPSAWHWDYGDGSTRDSTAGGNSWKSQNAAEFSRTATSHAYDRAGTFAVRPSIRFTAEYRFDGGDWSPVDGLVTIDLEPLSVVVGTASTVLVGADCGSEPTAPGC